MGLRNLFDEPDLEWLLMKLGGLIGGIAGIVIGFSQAGIGGAIAGVLLGTIVGALGALGIFFLFALLLLALPWLLILGALGICIWLMKIFWGVGKP